MKKSSKSKTFILEIERSSAQSFDDNQSEQLDFSLDDKIDEAIFSIVEKQIENVCTVIFLTLERIYGNEN